MSDQQPAVVVKDLYKSFKLPHEQQSGIKQVIINLAKQKKGYEVQHVLDDISFEIKKGEFFGIVGRNGSGKSTLLKLLAGIYAPDRGLVQVNGSLTPFIELGVGFNPELTGRENVFMNGALLGFSHHEMEAIYKDIVDFAELERFMDQKLKNYSSGMQVRLAFSIATQSKADILIFDEVLAVGDESFQKKCTNFFKSIKTHDQTVILVTHDMNNVDRFCDRVLVLNQGKCLGIFDTTEGKRAYEELNRSDSKDMVAGVNLEKRWGTQKIMFENISINNVQSTSQIVQHGGPFVVSLTFNEKALINQDIVIGVGISDDSGTYIAGPNTDKIGVKSNQQVSYDVPRLPLNKGRYYLELSLFNKDQSEEFDHIIEAVTFDVEDDVYRYGKIDMSGEWKIT